MSNEWLRVHYLNGSKMIEIEMVMPGQCFEEDEPLSISLEYAEAEQLNELLGKALAEGRK